MNEGLHQVVGIDLGTTYSAVAAFNHDLEESEIIVDETVADGQGAATPSVVRRSRDTGAVIVGHGAKNAIAESGSPAETIIEIKREMGEIFTKASLERFGALGTFAEDSPVKVRLGGAWLRPQEISALVLMHMKKIAQAGLGTEIHDAVITVPAYFTERQKKATEEAALLAGLYPRQLIPEPTAAAICYGVDKGEADRQIFLVFDLGGGTFDVSIIETQGEQIIVLATAGDKRLGGGDFDDAIVSWVLESLDGPEPGQEELLRIKAAAERAKRQLSFNETTTITLESGAELTLDRATFESLISGLMERALAQVREALSFAEDKKGVRRDEVDAVLLVGGSTRVPAVTGALLAEFGKPADFVKSDADPDTLVARGAALVAKRFQPSPAFDITDRLDKGLTSTEPDDLDVTLITEHTLGVGVQDNKCDELIPRGTKIPASQKKTYTNPALAEHIEATIYQGEGVYSYENTLIGTIHLADIEPRPEGYHKFEVEFALDINGLLEVKVTHENTGRAYEATFEQSTSIGKVNLLAERREALLALYEGALTAPPAMDIPPPLDIPAPLDEPAPISVLDPDQVPREFTRLVRKANDRLAAVGPPAALVSAYAAFAAALTSGADDATLDRVATDLEDALDHARG